MVNTNMANRAIKILIHFSLVVTIFIPVFSSAQDINVTNTAKYVGSGRYLWTVFLQANDNVLDGIVSVEYTLHPSFPNPVQVISERETNFALSSSSSSEFTMYVALLFNDGKKKYIEYRLNFMEGSDEAHQANPSQEKTTIYIVYTGDNFGCRLLITITIAGKSFSPTGSVFPVTGIPLGKQKYTIQGMIQCPTIGQCEAYGEGIINVTNKARFSVTWQNMAYSKCNIWLQ